MQNQTYTSGKIQYCISIENRQLYNADLYVTRKTGLSAQYIYVIFSLCTCIQRAALIT